MPPCVRLLRLRGSKKILWTFLMIEIQCAKPLFWMAPPWLSKDTTATMEPHDATWKLNRPVAESALVSRREVRAVRNAFAGWHFARHGQAWHGCSKRCSEVTGSAVTLWTVEGTKAAGHVISCSSGASGTSSERVGRLMTTTQFLDGANMCKCQDEPFSDS